MQETHSREREWDIAHRNAAREGRQHHCNVFVCEHENGSDMTRNSLITYAKEST